jgi:hypothetical protein
MTHEEKTRIQKILKEKLDSFPPMPRHELRDEWLEYLHGIDAVSLGRLVGLLLPEEEGVVRVKDPISVDGNHGFVCLTVDFAERMLLLGLP